MTVVEKLHLAVGSGREGREESKKPKSGKTKKAMLPIYKWRESLFGEFDS